MKINLENYIIVKVYDNYNWEIIGALLLNKKHNLEDCKNYFTNESTIPTVFDVVLDIINKGEKK